MAERPDVVSRRWAVTDVAVLLAACAGYVTLELCAAPKILSFGLMAVTALVYCLWIARRGGEGWRDFGFRTDNLRRSVTVVLPGTAIAVALSILWGLIADRPLWQPGMAALLPLYLPYGVFQQAVFQGVLLRRLRQLLGSPVSAVLLTATAFALVHLGYGGLVALTAVAGAFWSWAFSRCPNVFTVGISHGVLAALAYPLALGDNPLQRL